MELNEVLDKIQVAQAATKVFGEPVVRDGFTVIPAARIAGGGGGGADESDEDGGGGAGFGVRAKPAGALVIHDDGTVRWKVPFDLNKVIAGGQLVGAVFFLSVWLTRRSEARAAAKAAVASAMIAARSSS